MINKKMIISLIFGIGLAALCFALLIQQQNLPAERHSSISAADQYISNLPARWHDINRKAQPLWDSGITSKMEQGNNLITEFLIDTVCELERLYPELVTPQQSGREYYNDFAVQQYDNYISNVDSTGSMHSILAGGVVIDNLTQILFEKLIQYESVYQSFSFDNWKSKWVINVKQL